MVEFNDLQRGGGLKSWPVYRRRMAGALVVSLSAHALLAVAPWQHENAPQLETSAPIILNLEPEPEPSRQMQLVDTSVPADEAPENPERIAPENSMASDLSPTAGDISAPDIEEPGELDQLGHAAVEPTEITTAQEAPAQSNPDQPTAETEEQTADEPEERIQVAARAPEQLLPEPVSRPPAAPAVPEGEASALDQSAPTAVDRPLPTQSFEDGDAVGFGVLGFEAMRHELAPYLTKVRNAVENRWLIAIQMQYRGTDPTKAVIDCSIAPSGELLFARIHDAGDSMAFALLCKQAIERAAPFGPFPFEVPAMYREDTLRIRWTFRFL